MTTQLKGQHRGHCQLCGRVQVAGTIPLLAKHGYRVAGFGFFNGTCRGSGELPMQISREITDKLIGDLTTQAQRADVRAIALLAGALKPEQAMKRTAWGSVQDMKIIDPKGHTRYVPMMVPWLYASAQERKMQVELEAGEQESLAGRARSYIEYLTKLLGEVHGQPLIDRETEELEKVTQRKAKTEHIEGAYRSKAEQKRALEELSRTYEKIAREIKDRYLGEPARSHGDKGEAMYYALPFQLNHWRTKHSLMVLELYPDMRKQVDAIEILVINREEIKARPVIK